MDPIGRFIATAHQILGHDVTAAVIGAEGWDKALCLLCEYEKDPTAERRQAVVDAIGVTR
jgi:hypothetical protein